MNARVIVLGIGSVTLLVSLIVVLLGLAVWSEPLIAALGGLSSISSAAVLWLGLRLERSRNSVIEHSSNEEGGVGTNQFAKFAVGDLVYKYPSTRQREGSAGIATRVILGQTGDEPHVVYQCPDGSLSPILDCSAVGYGGGPPMHVTNASAIVKWLSDRGQPVASDKSHQEWPVEKVSNGWALARDPWDKRLHWLPSRSEYRLWVGKDERAIIVTMQTLVE